MKHLFFALGAEITIPEIAAREIKLSSSTTSAYTPTPTPTPTIFTPTSSASNQQSNEEKKGAVSK